MNASRPAQVARAVTVARAVLEVSRREQTTFLAAAVAYYAFVSLLPLLVLAIVVATAIGGSSLAVSIVTLAGDALTPTGEATIVDAITSSAGRSGVTVVGVALLTWGALKLFRGLDTAFSTVYGAGPRSFAGTVRDAFVTFVGVGAASVGVVVVGTVALTELPGAWFAQAMVPVALFAGFFVLYRLLPDAPVSTREALPGAGFATVSWLVLSYGFQIYTSYAATSVYGVLGAVLLTVTWLYLGSVVIVTGAVLNAVLAGRVATTGTGTYNSPHADSSGTK